MGLVILFFFLFLILPPGLFAILKFIKDRLKAYIFGGRRSKTSIKTNEKEGLNKIIRKRINFTMKDTRKKPIPFKLVFISIYSIGGIVSLIAGFSSSFKLFLFSIVIAYIAVIFSCVTADKIVKGRESVLKRMMELKASKMRLVNRDKGTMATPDTEFKILEWGEDLLNPVKMYIYLPTDFDILQVDGFMESFNLVFGSQGRWVEDPGDKNHQGFDFNAGVAALKVTPKLPTIANWHERYLNPEFVHWSYFPLALGSENGVPVWNEELGVNENVLGFAVNSGQNKLADKKGFKIGPEVTSSPQVLIAGGTGGGKALQSDTLIERVKE